MSAHTPGPWTVEVNDEGDMAFVRTSHGEMISACDLPDVLYLSIHNARLIAAAPDLLAVLNQICQNYGPAREDFMAGEAGDRAYQEACAVFNLAETAIAKAEGGH